MSKFGDIIRSAILVISSITVALSTVIKNWINSNLSEKPIGSHLFLVILFMIIFLGTDWILKRYIRRSESLRKWMMRDNYIEGKWFNVSVGKDAEIRDYAISEIYFDDEEMKIEGRLFNKSMEQVGSYESELSKLQRRKLKFGYYRESKEEREKGKKSVEKASGISKYDFKRSDPFPKEFEGEFYDDDLTEPVDVYGLKIEDQDLKEFKMDELRGSKKIIKKYKKKASRKFSSVPSK